MWHLQRTTDSPHLGGDSGKQREKFVTYCAHLPKSTESWCRLHHNDRDKLIFLNSKLDLVALKFDPGGPMAQYQLVVQELLMLACRSLTAVEAEYHWDYEEVAAHMQKKRRIDDLLKETCGKMVAPAGTCMELKLNIGSYCGLLWSIFGDQCN